MTCPKCGAEMIMEWKSTWLNSQGKLLNDIVFHCGKCWYDMVITTNQEGKEVERQQYFFG